MGQRRFFDGLNAATDSRLLHAAAGFVLAWLVLWTTLPLLSGDAIPNDNIEELNWAVHPALGYEKHPPLPMWIIYAFSRIFPATVPMTYALGALQVSMMMGAAWLIGRQLLGVRAAYSSVLLISCITFYTFRMHYFNHNTALLVATAGAVYCLWNATQSGKLLWWLALGGCWGIGMLSKYQMVVTIACNLAYLWTQRSVNTTALLRGSMLAGVIGVALVLPHVFWVLTHDSPTIHYAMNYVGVERSLATKASRMLSFNADQLLRLLPALLLLLMVRRFRTFSVEPAALDDLDDQHRAQVKRFLTIHAWGPLIIMNLLCLLIGLNLGMHWGTAFLWMLPLWYVTTPSGKALSTVKPATLLVNAALVQGVMVLGFILPL